MESETESPEGTPRQRDERAPTDIELIAREIAGRGWTLKGCLAVPNSRAGGYLILVRRPKGQGCFEEVTWIATLLPDGQLDLSCGHYHFGDFDISRSARRDLTNRAELAGW